MPAGQNAVRGKQGFQAIEKQIADIADLDLPAVEAGPVPDGLSSQDAFDEQVGRTLSDEEWAQLQPHIADGQFRAWVSRYGSDDPGEWRDRVLSDAGIAGEVCSHCGADLSDNEGYDGHCGSCADRLENGEDLDGDDPATLPHFTPRAAERRVPDPAAVWKSMEGHVRSIRPEVAKRMYDNWFSVPAAARDEAIAAAWRASEGAPAEVTWHQTSFQTPPVRFAAIGKATHSLIGTGGYTQEHYDLLTGPWRRARISTLTNGDPRLE